MTDVFGQPWFGWALVVVIVFPVLLVLFTEVHTALVRRGSSLAKPVSLLRNYVLPAGALLILLTQAGDVSAQATPVRIIATVFGFVVLLMLLAAINAALFTNAERGTWQQRIPSIFVDIVRLVLIIAGLAVLFSFVWDADVAGLFTALGVTSIVLGLALQNAVGSVISGLLLLFEQPFQLGDWLQTPTARGRVVEVNWRAVHIDTGNGIQIMPNAALASASFTNLSRPSGAHATTISSTFALRDRPDEVLALLARVAGNLPQLLAGTTPSVTLTGPKTYSTTVKVGSPADAGAVTATLQRWTWYAARRAGLHLDEADDDFNNPELLEASVREVAPTLRLTESDIDDLVRQSSMERYAAGEIIQQTGLVPDSLRLIIKGRAALNVALPDGSFLVVHKLAPGDYIGQTALTREPVTAGANAVDELTVLRVPVAALDSLVRGNPALAREIGKAIDARRLRIQESLRTLAPADRPSSSRGVAGRLA
ncbi:MAG: mechanosensitive ion channel domain-containing protein, partial [Nakamurella sp.]